MKLFIDGDGSPVKEETIELARKYQLPVVIVTSVDHYTTKEYPDFVTFVYVDKGADSADYRIVGLTKPGDVLVTQDYGLASLVLSKGVRVIHQLGKEYTSDNIETMLEQRYFSAKLRKAGQRTKGPKAFTSEDRERFEESLEAIIRKQVGEE
ncbi:hypothetical protein BAU15_02290 [Enterococcus sp. JM4C]|uniref:YaiI/YqxD family protein n=1 Tax=Candidatus Enterococcus huntleyi TaxID=1857217 RepID=UPI001379F1C8|nr:YaiI/YqxD family protein [Enterococcus sp. JM4C]KAF1299492.1 hypothetical protein BAU15_02290 [Enterococcus sp. JM4C]